MSRKPLTAEAEAARAWEANDPFKRAADGSILPGQDVGNLFDDVLDQAHSTQGDARHVSQDEIDKAMRWERGFLQALKAETTRRLMGEPMCLVAVDAYLADDGNGYTVEFRDQQHRHRVYKVTAPMDDLIGIAVAASQSGSNDAGRAMIEKTCELAVRAKQEYLRRMT